MATIKSFTSLEQSKKLAEILPLESADMFIADVINSKEQIHSYAFHILTTWGCKTFAEIKERESNHIKFIPCWTLSALLCVLGEGYSLRNRKGKFYVRITHIYHEILLFDNPVDACVDMIIKLKEADLL